MVGFLYSFVIVLVVRPVEVSVIVMVSGTYITNFVNQFICIGDEKTVEWVSTIISLLEICKFKSTLKCQIFVFVSLRHHYLHQCNKRQVVC